MATNVYVLGSGSKGNCSLLENGRDCILVDCGLSLPTMKRKLAELGISVRDINGILISHEHDDHVKGLRYFGTELPVYAHEETMERIAPFFGIPLENQCPFSDGDFHIGSFDVSTFVTSHDVVHPLGFSISDGVGRFTYATDSGYVTREMYEKAKGSDLVLIESNHDVDMLRSGRYPAFLKSRILGKKGHLSNDACAEAVTKLVSEGTSHFILGHISENNNLPELAYWTTNELLKEAGADLAGIKLSVADQYRTTAYSL